MVDSLRSDDELCLILDESGMWLVRDGLQIVPTSTLREALHKAHDMSIQKNFIGPIVKMPDDEIKIDARQTYQLWQRIGLKAN